MPKIPDETVSTKDMLDALATADAAVIPIVSRKINIGNFETIDIGLAIKLPVAAKAIATPEDLQELKDRLVSVAEEGFGIVSEETFSRYMSVKEQISGGAR